MSHLSYLSYPIYHMQSFPYPIIPHGTPFATTNIASAHYPDGRPAGWTILVRSQMKKWLVLDDGQPSLNHSRFDTEGEAQSEADRLNKCISDQNARNDRVRLSRTFQKGDGFILFNRKNIFTVGEIEVPF